MPFSAIAPWLLKVRRRRGGGYSTYFGGDASAVESAVADALSIVGNTGRAGDLSALESLGDFLTASGNLIATAGFDFYISPFGNDNNDGRTPATPWSLTALNTKRGTYAGKRVGALDGTYQLYALIQAGANDGYSPVIDMASGTSSSPTILQAVNPRMAIFKCSNDAGTPPSANNPVIGNHNVGSLGNLRIDGIQFDTPGPKCIYLGFYSGNTEAEYTFAPGYVVQNCWFHGWNPSLDTSFGNNYSCIEVAGVQGFRCVNNRFSNATGHFGAKDGNHMSSTLQWFGRDCLYEFNSITDAPGIYGKEHGNKGTIIRYNLVDMTGWTTSTGVGCVTDFSQDFGDATGTNPTLIHHNVLIGACCIDTRHVIDGGDNRPSIWIYNNTLRLKSGGQPNAILAPIVGGGARIFNNVVYSEATGDLELICIPVGSVGLSDFNLFYSTTGTYIWSTFNMSSYSRTNHRTSIATWRADIGGNPDLHSIVGSNPSFAGSGIEAEFYRLNGGPAVGAGRSDGTTSGDVVDMGAWGNNPPVRIGPDYALAA